MKYKFDLVDGQYGDGYGLMIVENGEAEIDPDNKAQMFLVEKHGGELVKVEKKVTKKLPELPTATTKTDGDK